MKRLRIIMCACFFILLLIPVATFNWKENVTSKIDNRVLANNPFGKNYEKNDTSDITDIIEEYVNDRIGLRDSMINGYTVLHDKLFHQMVHPTYMYGKDGYILYQVGENIEYGEHHARFANMVADIQTYCEERNIPFLFVFEPSKTAVLSDKLPEGVHFRDDWVKEFEQVLRQKNVNYIDNTQLLRTKLEEGEQVFNKQYDAGHWNDLGAFYAVNHILETMKETVPEIHINTMDEFDIVDIFQTSLPVSEFPIEEHTPYFVAKQEAVNRTESYIQELKMDEANSFFNYTENEERKAEGAPKTMVMQGSYMNEMGGKFFQNSQGEYIGIHSYQNIMDFDYYYNIFKPEYVVFEVTEYVFTEEYFSSERMKNMDLPPILESFEQYPVEQRTIEELSINKEDGQQLVVIKTKEMPVKGKYAYLLIGDETYEFQRKADEKKGWFELTIDKDNFKVDSMSVKVVDVARNSVVEYK